MATGRPDYNLMTAIRGQYGAELKVVAVDSAGRIIMVPIGSSGNYMSVDASGYLSTIMKGIDGVTLRTVAVDASGNILGLLQGDYEGAVKTLAVDAQGRMLAVLTDPEDVFGNPHYMGAAELAVRGGSIVNFDRIGQVVLLDGFESGVRKWDHEVDTGCSITESAVTARNGLLSAKMSVDNVAGHEAYMQRSVPYPPAATRFGKEYSFVLDTGNGAAATRVYVKDSAHLWIAGLKYDGPAGKLYYLADDFDWDELATVGDLFGNLWDWNTWKFVIDLATGKYVRARVNGAEYDLSAYSMFSQVDTDPANITARISCEYSAGNEVLYADDCILTANEPA